MRILLLFPILLFPLFLSGQSNDSTFLMYARMIGYSLTNNSLKKEVPVDTSFMVQGIMTLSKSKAYIREFRLTGKAGKERKWTFHRDNENVILAKGDLVKRFTIINDTTLTWKSEYDSMEFFIVPIAKDLRFDPYKGQLVSRKGNFKTKIILEEQDDETGLQKSTVIYNYDSLPAIVEGVAKYVDLPVGNLVYIEGWFQFIQVTRVASDSILHVNSFSSSLSLNGRLKTQMVFSKKDFPQTIIVQGKQENLQGSWKSVSGHIIDNWTFTPSPLRECQYEFEFSGNRVIIEKKFFDPKFKNATDTLTWSINPTGDFIFIKEHSRLSDRHIFLKELAAKTASFVIDDYWFEQDKRKRAILMLEMRKN
jgi:hypothetical protein